MARQSKRTSAPAPSQPVPTTPAPPPRAQSIPPVTSASMFGPGPWCPPCAPPYWLPGLQHPSMAGPSAQPPWWAPPSNGTSANTEDSDVQAWGVDCTLAGGFVNLLQENTPSNGFVQAVGNGSSSQPINISGGTNETGDRIGSSSQPINISGGTNKTAGRIEKRMLWTKDEDCTLVGAWVNNSNDAINSNYKKNEQYWKEVANAYNSEIPRNRARQMKQIKDRFGRIKKRVSWFCASWKEANALWASGESDVDLMDRAMKIYEEEHKADGPFMFKHCWDILRQQPKWDAYLERLEDLSPEKRKFSVEDDVVGPICVDDASDEERPIGGKKAKELQKKRKKDQVCVVDLEGELKTFVEAQKKATEGRKEMLETQKRVSSENLEARKLAYLAAKENKESAMLETYRELLKEKTTEMSEDVRSKHVIALKCLRAKLFGNSG